MSVGVYENWGTHRNSFPHNTGDVNGGLSSHRPDANGIRLVSNTYIADVDIVIARSEIAPGEIAQCDVADAGCVVKERIVTGGSVAVAGGVGKERKTTGSGVPDGGGVGKERVMTGCRSRRWQSATNPRPRAGEFPKRI